MEDGLRVSVSAIYEAGCDVLILVLVEDGLRGVRHNKNIIL